MTAQQTPAPYEITVCSTPDHERLVAEVYVNDVFVGQITEEHGGEADREFEISPSGASVNLDTLIRALEAGKLRLAQMGSPKR
jgi:hypothetical protein